MISYSFFTSYTFFFFFFFWRNFVDWRYQQKHLSCELKCNEIFSKFYRRKRYSVFAKPTLLREVADISVPLIPQDLRFQTSVICQGVIGGQKLGKNYSSSWVKAREKYPRENPPCSYTTQAIDVRQIIFTLASTSYFCLILESIKYYFLKKLKSWL